MFTGAEDPALPRYRPEALAGSLAQILEVAKRMDSGELGFALEHSVTVFVSLYTGLLDDRIRDFLWRVFQVPVFEQLRGPSLELLAWECEAHHGVHTNDRLAQFEGGDEMIVHYLSGDTAPGVRVRTGLIGQITTETCACGIYGTKVHRTARKTVLAIGAAAGRA